MNGIIFTEFTFQRSNSLCLIITNHWSKTLTVRNLNPLDLIHIETFY